MKHCLVFLLLHIAVLPVCCLAQIQGAGNVKINIKATFNGKPLNTTQPFVSPHGDTFYVDAFRFYISNISFIGYPSQILTNNHLFDLDDSGSYSFAISVSPGDYDLLKFTLGVDSIANTNGANSGDLDPSKGMYWAWNSGYIMAKLEGHSSACKTLHHAFEFHIGGYLPPYNTARPVTLNTPEKIQVSKRDVPCITLTADIASWFTPDLDLSKINSIMIPGKDAAMMADRYSKMISIENITYLSPVRR